MLLAHLPRESAFVQSVGGDKARWGDIEHLLASLIDNVRLGSFYSAVAASTHRFTDRPKWPDPIPRPGDEPRKRQAHGYSPEQMSELLARWRSGELSMVDTTAVEVT